MKTRGVGYIFADKSNSNAKGKEKKWKVYGYKQGVYHGNKQDKDIEGERVHVQLLYKSLPE